MNIIIHVRIDENGLYISMAIPAGAIIQSKPSISFFFSLISLGDQLAQLGINILSPENILTIKLIHEK